MPKVDLIPTAEVADRIGVHVRTVHRWVNDGRLIPVVKTPGIRGVMMFDPADIEVLIAEQRSA